MVLLAIDSSQQNGSFTLARINGNDIKILETVAVHGGTFSAQLVPEIAESLQRHNLDKKEVGALAACVGPGSFTGLRIGLAAVKGLAEVLRLPIIAISALELLARESPADGLIFAALDARRGEVFVGEYRRQGGVVKCDREYLCTAAEFGKRIIDSQPSGVVAGDGRLADLARAAGAKVIQKAQPGSDALARVAHEKLQRGETTSVEALDAEYLRHDNNLFFTRK